MIFKLVIRYIAYYCLSVCHFLQQVTISSCALLNVCDTIQSNRCVPCRTTCKTAIEHQATFVLCHWWRCRRESLAIDSQLLCSRRFLRLSPRSCQNHSARPEGWSKRASAVQRSAQTAFTFKHSAPFACAPLQAWSMC